MNTSEISNILIGSGIFAALLSLAVSGIKYGKALLDVKTKATTSRMKSKETQDAINRAEDCVTTVVYELAQTTVDDLKEKSADGKLTNEEIAELKADALAKITQLMGTEVTATIHSVFGDGEAWILSKIQAAVKKLKIETPVSISFEPTIAPTYNNTETQPNESQEKASEQAENNTSKAPAETQEAAQQPETAAPKATEHQENPATEAQTSETVQATANQQSSTVSTGSPTDTNATEKTGTVDALSAAAKALTAGAILLNNAVSAMNGAADNSTAAQAESSGTEPASPAPQNQ